MSSQGVSAHFSAFSAWVVQQAPSVQEVYQQDGVILWGLVDGEHEDFQAAKQAVDHLLTLARSSGISEMVTDFLQVAEEIEHAEQNWTAANV